MNKFFLLYFLIINAVGTLIMIYDKKRAVKNQWRVSEAKLFFISILFGSIGILIGMYVFHHKTKHLKFVIGIPAILFIQVCLIIKLFIV